MRVIPTLFALALATPALSIPVPRSLFARNDVSQQTSSAPTASGTDVSAVNNAVTPTPTTAGGLAADPAASDRIINDLLTFAHGDPSVLLEQMRPLANDLGTMVDGMIKGSKISWMQGFNSPPPGQNNAANNGQQSNPTTTTVTVTATPTTTSSDTSTATATGTDTTSATSTDPNAAAATPTSSGDGEDGDTSSTSPPGVGGGEEPERRSLHSKRDAPGCAKIYQSDPGDTCEIVARKFGVSSNAILSANPFVDCNDIWTATSICIPAFSCSQMITTQDGDTCQSIATRYQVSPQDIQSANVFLNCNSIAASTQVCVPPAPGHGSANYGGYGTNGANGGYGGYGGNQNMNMGYGNYQANPALGMQFAMMGLGMMNAGMNPGSPQNMPPIPVNSDNVAKLKAYIERMQLIATALERFNSTGTSTNATPTPAPTVVAAAATTAPTPTSTDTTTTTSASTTDTATSTTSTDSAASATPTDSGAAPDEKARASTHSHPQMKQAVVGKTHPWR